MKLRDTMICIDCEEIFEPLGVYRFDGGDMAVCPICGNAVTARLSNWIQTMEHFRKEEVGA